MKMQRIVAAVDGSTQARRAAERALQLGDQLNSEVSFVHVYSPGPRQGLSAVNATHLVDHNRGLADKAMQVLLAQLGSPQVDTIVDVGADVPGTICSHGRGADLIVLGTIGRTGVSRFHLGSVAESVVRRAHCPVWVERTPSSASLGLGRLLVCTDLSPLSETGLALAAEMAPKLGLSVEVVYALEPAYHGLSVDVLKDVTGTLEGQLSELAAKYFGPTQARVSIVEGANAVDAITAHATRTSPDLLVLATHGRTGLRRAFMGSVAERLVRFAPCSALVARSPVEP